VLVGLLSGLIIGAAATWGLPWVRRRFRLRAVAAGSAVTIGGRRYHVIEHGTVEWNGWFVRMLGEVGLMPLPDIGVAEDGGAYLQRLTQELVAGGQCNRVLAGMLLRQGVPASRWHPDMPAEIEQELRATPDAAQIYALTRQFLIDFFVGGTASSVLSISSSKTAEDRPAIAAGRVIDTASGLALSAS